MRKNEKNEKNDESEKEPESLRAAVYMAAGAMIALFLYFVAVEVLLRR